MENENIHSMELFLIALKCTCYLFCLLPQEVYSLIMTSLASCLRDSYWHLVLINETITSAAEGKVTYADGSVV